MIPSLKASLYVNCYVLIHHQGHPLGCKNFCFQPCEITCKMKLKKLSCGHVVVHRCSDRTPDCEECRNPQPSTSGKPSVVGKSVKASEGTAKKTKAVESKRCSRTCAFGHTCAKAHAKDAKCPPCEYSMEKMFKSCVHQYEQKCGESFEPLCVANCERRLRCGHQCAQLCSIQCDSRPCQVI